MNSLIVKNNLHKHRLRRCLQQQSFLLQNEFICDSLLAVKLDDLLTASKYLLSVCKDPPYKVEESGYAGFILPIEVYFKNKVC